jgi:hypothetical protein
MPSMPDEVILTKERTVASKKVGNAGMVKLRHCSSQERHRQWMQKQSLRLHLRSTHQQTYLIRFNNHGARRGQRQDRQDQLEWGSVAPPPMASALAIY